VNVLIVHSHPEPRSFCSALMRAARDELAALGHAVTVTDLYAEGFDPVLSREERHTYLDVPENRASVESYVRRIERAEGLILVHPVWNFGYPAILKGFLDRVFLPGVSFRLVDGLATPALTHIRVLATVTTYGSTRWRAFLMGDPPRKLAKRMLRVLVAPGAKSRYLALHDMNRQTPERREAFLIEVDRVLGRL
jgi:putative NADPH-quinone reductase